MDHTAFCRLGASARLILIVVACLLAGLGKAQAFEASFDCAKAGTPVEKMICSDAALAEEDRGLAKLYQTLRQIRPDAVKDQGRWLRERDTCGDIPCILTAYLRRHTLLAEVLQDYNAQSGKPPIVIRPDPPDDPAYETPPPKVVEPVPDTPKPAEPTEYEQRRNQFSSASRAINTPVKPSPPVQAQQTLPPVPVETVSTWQEIKTYIQKKSGYLAFFIVVAGFYFVRRFLKQNRLYNEYCHLAKSTHVYQKAAGILGEFHHWLERTEAKHPILAFLGVMLVAFLSSQCVHGFNVTTHNIVSKGIYTLVTYSGFISYADILEWYIQYAIIFLVLFSLARVPFYAGVLISFLRDIAGGDELYLFTYPAILVPFALEAGLLVYVVRFEWETVLAWLAKWRQRKKSLQTLLGFAAYFFLVFQVGQFAAKQYWSWVEGLVWIAAFILLGFWFKKSRRPPETYLFDATKEPEKYFKNDGVVLGWNYCNIPEPNPAEEGELMPYAKAPHVVRYKTDKHFLSIMPNRSGKGRSQIIPNLLQLADWSCWVIDPKGENALTTAQWRRDQGHEIVIFNPYGLWEDEFKARGFTTFQTFNPLLNLDPESERFVGDVDALTDALVYSTGGDAHWSEGAKGLVSLLIMYLVTEPTETPTFRRLRELIAGGYNGLLDAFGLMSENPLDLVRENVGRYDKETKEVHSVIAIAETQTGIFRNKTLCNALDGGAFDFEAMKHKKMTVYMILPAEYLVTQARFLRLILLSAMSQFTRSEEGEHRIMVLLDEFANLGPLQMVEQGAALISGYGVTLWPFVQNLSQLQKLYPNNWEVFIANAAAITVANVNDVTTAEYFSKRAGKTIKHLFSSSSSFTSNTGEKSSSSSTSGHSKSESIQDMLPVEDIYNLHGSATYVFFEGKAPPLIAIKSNYDDKRLPWHGRAAVNPMVKVWR